MKKILWIFALALIIVSESNAGMVVGDEKIEVVQDNYTERLNIKDPIVLVKPSNKDGIQLISYEDFLKKSENKIKVISPKEEVISKSVKEEVIKGTPIFDAVSSAKEEITREEISPVVAPEEVIVKKAPIEEDIAPVVSPENAIKDLHIYYDTSMKTFLSKENKIKLKEIVDFAMDNNLRINILTSASGDKDMADRVSLLRANIIKSALRGYGLTEDKMEVKSLGSNGNGDISKVFLVK